MKNNEEYLNLAPATEKDIIKKQINTVFTFIIPSDCNSNWVEVGSIHYLDMGGESGHYAILDKRT